MAPGVDSLPLAAIAVLLPSPGCGRARGAEISSGALAAPSISVVVPVYNEEAWWPASSLQCAICSRARGAPSRPRGRQRLAGHDRRGQQPLLDDPRIGLVSNGANRGKGFSVRRGMLEVSGETRLLCDADCVLSLESLPDMLAALEEADLVCGSRVAAGARVDRHQPLRRRIFGWPYLNLVRLVLREPTYDLFCGFKLWRGAAADAVFARQRVTAGPSTRSPPRWHAAWGSGCARSASAGVTARTPGWGCCGRSSPLCWS